MFSSLAPFLLLVLPGKIPTLSNFSFLPIQPHESTQLNVAEKKMQQCLPSLTKFMITNLEWIWCLTLLYFPHILFPPVILSRSVALNISYVIDSHLYTTSGYLLPMCPGNRHLKQPSSHGDWIQYPAQSLPRSPHHSCNISERVKKNNYVFSAYFVLGTFYIKII